MVAANGSQQHTEARAEQPETTGALVDLCLTYGTNKIHLNHRSIHVVSQIHVIIVVPLVIWVLARETKERSEDRAFGWSEDVGFVHAIACGCVKIISPTLFLSHASLLYFFRYFLWDSLDAIINFTDLGFVLHGAHPLSLLRVMLTFFAC